MANSMNKKEIVNLVAERLNGTKKEAQEYVNEIFNIVEEALKEGSTVDISGFGKFTIAERAERKGINPATKESIVIPASKSVKFKASKTLKDAIQ